MEEMNVTERWRDYSHKSREFVCLTKWSRNHANFPRIIAQFISLNRADGIIPRGHFEHFNEDMQADDIAGKSLLFSRLTNLFSFIFYLASGDGEVRNIYF